LHATTAEVVAVHVSHFSTLMLVVVHHNHNIITHDCMQPLLNTLFRGRLKGGFGLMLGDDAARHAAGKTRLIAVMVSCK